MIVVSIRLGELEIEVSSDQTHPDHLTDITNRAITAFHNAVATSREAQFSVYGDEPEIDSSEE